MTNTHQEHKWQRRKEDRPSEIIDAALELFVEHGFTATRLDEVAARAGVSKGTVYLYFENKEELFCSVVQEVILPEIQRFEVHVRDYQGSYEKLVRNMILEWWNVMGKSRMSGIPKLVIAEASNFPDMAKYYVDNVVKRVRKIVEEVIRKGIKADEFKSCDVKSLTRVIMAPMVFAAIWERSLAPFDDEEYSIEKYIDSFLDTLFSGIKLRGVEKC